MNVRKFLLQNLFDFLQNISEARTNTFDRHFVDFLIQWNRVNVYEDISCVSIVIFKNGKWVLLVSLLKPVVSKNINRMQTVDRIGRTENFPFPTKTTASIQSTFQISIQENFESSTNWLGDNNKRSLRVDLESNVSAKCEFILERLISGYMETMGYIFSVEYLGFLDLEVLSARS